MHIRRVYSAHKKRVLYQSDHVLSEWELRGYSAKHHVSYYYVGYIDHSSLYYIHNNDYYAGYVDYVPVKYYNNCVYYDYSGFLDYILVDYYPIHNHIEHYLIDHRPLPDDTLHPC